MNPISVLNESGVQCILVGTGQIKLLGLSKLSNGEQDRLINYTKSNKQAIINELLSSSLDSRYNFLPESCPFKTGGDCPPGCRFTTTVLVDLIKSRPVYHCPFFTICEERK